MKNQNNIFTTTLVALAFALALGAEAKPTVPTTSFPLPQRALRLRNPR